MTLEVPDDSGFGQWQAEVTSTVPITNIIRRDGAAFPVKGAEFFQPSNPSAADTQVPLARALEVTSGGVDVSVAVVTLQVTAAVAGFQSGDLEVTEPNGKTGATITATRTNCTGTGSTEKFASKML